MASNNYTSANVVPSSDTFREWVDLTNRITYDMEKRVVTTEMHSVGGGTTGNAYVNGFFSANTLMITDSIQGVGTDDSSNVVGANSALANLIISTNATFIANSTHYSHINAQANVHVSGGLLDVDAIVDIDNADTDITATDFTLTGTTANLDSTTTAVNGTTLDINSTNIDVDSANVDIAATELKISGTSANVHSTTLLVNGTTIDAHSNVDIDNALTDINATSLKLSGTTANLDSTTTNIKGTLLDITSTDVNVSGTNATIDSTHLDIHGTSLDINSATNIDGVLTVTNNATIGNANSDLLTVNSNTVLTDKLNVQEAVDLDTTLNVDGDASFNANVTLGDANTDSVNFVAEVSSGIIPESNTLALGLDDARWILNANTINASGDITAQADVDVAGEANVNSLVVVTDASVQGDTTLGNANTDLVTFNARSSNIEPSANDNLLGTNLKRWELNARAVNASNASIFSNTLLIVGDVTANSDVDVAGEANSDTLHVRSTSFLNAHVTAAANVNIGTELRVAGDTFIHHGSTDGIITVSEGKITVGSGTVNTAITPTSINTDGTLDVLGATSLASTLGVSKAASLANTISVTGNTTLSNAVAIVGPATLSNTISVANNATITGTLGVTRATTLSSTLEVTGTSTLTGDVTAVGNIKAASANVSGHSNVATLGATGTVDLDSTLNVDGATTLGDTLAVTNTASLSNTLTVAGKSTLSSANVSGTLQANGAVDLNSTLDVLRNASFSNSMTVTGAVDINNTLDVLRAATLSNTLSVAGNTTLSKTLAAGNTTLTGFINVSTTSNLTGVVTTGSDVDISGEANSATLRSRGIANVDGLLRAKSNLVVTGTANASVAIHVGTANTKVRLANNDIAVGNAAANSKLTSTSISTTGTLTVSSTAALGDTTINGNASVTNNLDATFANVGGLRSTGPADIDGALNVDGATTLNGDVDLGNASGDDISFTGRVDSSLQPTANGKVLGHTSRRWKGVFTSANTSDSLSVGSTITGGNTSITGFVNATTSGQFGTTLTVGGNTDINGTHIYLGSNASILSGSNVTTLSTTKAVVANLEVSGSAVLPSDTTLDIAEANTAVLKVRANAEFSTGANVVIGIGSNPSGRATVNLTNAHFTSTMVLNDGMDIGTNANGVSTFVSGSSGTRANTTALETDNVYARNDLVANYSSDKRLKDKVIKIDTALNKVNDLSGYQFEWNQHIDDYRIGTVDYGVLAQELESVLPHAVDINNRGYKTVNYNSLIPLLIEAVKELSSKVEKLEGEQ